MITHIRAAEVGSTVWDKGEAGSVPGLHCRILGPEKRVFYLFYRTRAGQQRRPKLGDFGALTVTQARKRAKDMLEEVARGIDPKGSWDRAKSEPTVGDLFQAAWAGHWDAPRYHESGWAKDVRSLWLKDLGPVFAHCKASELDGPRVRQWHRGYARTTPYVGNRALQVLSKVYAFGREEGLLLVLGPDGIRRPIPNPCEGVKPHPEMKRKRYASEDEIRAIVAALERHSAEMPESVAFLFTLLMSGSRPRLIERARPEHLATFPGPTGELWGKLVLAGKSKSKTGDDDEVFLPPVAMEVIQKLPPQADGTLFGRKMPRKLWTKIKAEVGCGDLWARDMRRTFATVGLSKAGVELSKIGELLNHRGTQTTKRYAKLMDGSRVEAVAAIANRISEIASSKVVPIRRVD